MCNRLGSFWNRWIMKPHFFYVKGSSQTSFPTMWRKKTEFLNRLLLLMPDFIVGGSYTIFSECHFCARMDFVCKIGEHSVLNWSFHAFPSNWFWNLSKKYLVPCMNTLYVFKINNAHLPIVKCCQYTSNISMHTEFFKKFVKSKAKPSVRLTTHM